VLWAVRNGAPVRFIDLPSSERFADADAKQPATQAKGSDDAEATANP
jgi:hypothetical protein